MRHIANALATEIGLENAKRQILNIGYGLRFIAHTSNPTIKDIAVKVAAERRISLAQILGDDRHAYIAHSRFKAWWIAHRKYGYSYPRIGASFGGRHHTSVLHGVRRWDDMMAQEAALKIATE
jgi:chromosomal replication initiation ATPase DnaA